MPLRNAPLRVSRNLLLTVAVFLLLMLAFGLYVRSEQDVDQANERRLVAIDLAHELRRSSNDLTRMVRTYVATREHRYKDFYHQIIEIREGRRPRPEGYAHAYWDLMSVPGAEGRVPSGRAVALLTLMQESGLAPAELAALVQAKTASDRLAAVEREAMGLVEADGADAEVRWVLARTMLYDADYHRARAEIMGWINDAFTLIEARTQEEVRSAQRLALVFRLVFIACVALALYLLWRTYAALRLALGGSAREIHAHIRRIGGGDLERPIPVPPGVEGGVLAGLEEMREMLHRSELLERAVFAASPDAMLISDGEGRIMRANPQVERLLGYPVAELVGCPIELLVPGSAAKREAGSAVVHGQEAKALCKDGRLVDVEICLSRIEGREGPLFVSALRDISERRRQEVRIHRLLAENQTILDNAMVGIVHIRQRRIVACNRRFEEIFVYGPGELTGESSECLYDSRETYERLGIEAYALMSQGQSYNAEVKLRHKDGSFFWGQLTGRVIDPADPHDGSIWIYSDITERHRAERLLKDREQRLRTIVDNEPDCIKVVDAEGRLRHINPAGLRMLEADTLEQIAGRPLVDFIVPEYREVVGQLHRRVLAGETVKLEFEIQGLKGRRRWLETHAVPMEDEGETVQLSVTRDITSQKQAAIDLRIAAAAFESQEGMMVTDAAGVILRVNTAFTKITGYAPEDVVGKTPALLKSGLHDAAFYQQMWECILNTGGWQGEVWDRRKSGEVYPKWLTISAVKGEDGSVTHYVGTHFDISDRKKAEQKIEELAFFDQLTGLPNRTLLRDRLKQAMTASRRNDSCCAMLFIDLDNFKTLNDSLGHDKGDLLLGQVSRRLVGSVREGDTVARLGGDEFLVVLGGLKGNPEEAANQTEVVGEKILAALNEPYHLDGVFHRTSASIGVTVFKGHETSTDELLKQADLAMYQSKDAGRNALRFFDPAMQTMVMERMALEKDLREALGAGQFFLYYQAQVRGLGHIVGAEVLLRWQHPTRGLVSPAAFIPLAEETGLILPLGEWVLEMACAQLARWALQPAMQTLGIAVNVSAHQFSQPDFVGRVMSIIERSGADPRLLKLELTESTLVSNVDDIIDKMFALRAKGVRFALDDFGTGFSSLSYLKRLPLDQLKIDQSFVRDVLSDPNDAAIARTVIALAQSLGLGVIAEGVETEAQRAFLEASGCHAYQGYHFARPLPVEAFEALLDAS